MIVILGRQHVFKFILDMDADDLVEGFFRLEAERLGAAGIEVAAANRR